MENESNPVFRSCKFSVIVEKIPSLVLVVEVNDSCNSSYCEMSRRISKHAPSDLDAHFEGPFFSQPEHL